MREPTWRTCPLLQYLIHFLKSRRLPLTDKRLLLPYNLVMQIISLVRRINQGAMRHRARSLLELFLTIKRQHNERTNTRVCSTPNHSALESKYQPPARVAQTDHDPPGVLEQAVRSAP